MVRRRILLGGGVAAVAAAAGYRYSRPPMQPVVPAAPAGDERLEQRLSAARGRTVDFYTAVPAGHGDGDGLPVCLVLHGGSTTAADFPRLGLGRFLTDAVRRGSAPFVLAGATGGRLSWRPAGADDPQRLVHAEIPRWCAGRGFDTTRLVACGWSMGGYGALRLAATFPGFVRAVGALSPAVSPGDDIFAASAELRNVPVGLWCGEQDGFYDDVLALAEALPPSAGSFGAGEHNFGYWSRCLPAALDFLAAALTPG